MRSAQYINRNPTRAPDINALFLRYATRRGIHNETYRFALRRAPADESSRQSCAEHSLGSARRAGLSAHTAAEWKGLSRATFFDAAERRRAVELLDRYATYCKERPLLMTPLFSFLKGDPESIAQANQMIIDGKKTTFEIAHGLEPFTLIHAFTDQLTVETRATCIIGSGRRSSAGDGCGTAARDATTSIGRSSRPRNLSWAARRLTCRKPWPR